MRKLAIFVEGYTELLFIDRLICEIAERRHIAIHHRTIRGGGKKSGIPKKIIELQTPESTVDQTLYFLIVDCGGDELVAQRIREEHESLTKNGYEKIVGLRDVFPKFSHADIPRLKRGLRYGIKTGLTPVQFLLSVMELEAWFLAEYNHFLNLDETLTVDLIRTQLGFDPATDDMTSRLTPAQDLASAYSIAGKTYTKGDAKTTIDKLDYDHVYAVLRDHIPDLRELLDAIDEFIKPIPSGH
jgi:hypothetical protein